MNELKSNIIKLCNESGLPLEAILFVVRDCYRDVEQAFENYEQEQNKEKEEPDGEL